MVTLKDNTATKGQSPWKIGYRIVQMLSDRTAQIEHVESGKKYRTSVAHLKRTEPLAVLLENSQIDVFPGCTKLYLPASDMPDLNWEASGLSNDAIEPIIKKLKEAVRDRDRDQEVQSDYLMETPPDQQTKAPTDACDPDQGDSQLITDNSEESQQKHNSRPRLKPDRTERSKRRVQKPSRFRDFVMVANLELIDPTVNDETTVYLVAHHSAGAAVHKEEQETLKW